jgi:hypothetical protein
MDASSTSHRARASFALLSLALACGCGTALFETSVPFSASLIPRLRQAASSVGCHEGSSDRFELFVFCPGPKQALGITHAEGKLLISCPNKGRRRCRKLFERVRNATRTTAGAATAKSSSSEQ